MGESDLLRAFSSQLDFVGLHLLLGLAGGLITSPGGDLVSPGSETEKLTSKRDADALLARSVNLPVLLSWLGL